MNVVTIAIASYNNGKYIERCVESVIHQTYQNLEILIVDDGSQDDTLSRLEKYKSDYRVRIVRKENGGLSSVRQSALDLSSGDYICFIDADDYLNNQYVELMIAKLLADRSDICICSTRFVDELGVVYQKGKYVCKDSTEQIIPSIGIIKDIKETITRKLYLSDSWNKMYKREFLLHTEVKFCMPQGYNGTDSIFNRLLVLHEPYYSTISYLGYVHVNYKKSAVHRKKRQLYLSYTFIVDKIKIECEKLGILTQMEDYISAFYTRCIVASCFDVYYDNPRYMDCVKGLELLFKQHMDFVKRNNINLLPFRKIVSLHNKILVFIFMHCRTLLPLVMRAYSIL